MFIDATERGVDAQSTPRIPQMPEELPACFVEPGQGECPICGVFDLFGRKWTLHLVWTLREERSVRFNELKRRAEGISPRVLSDRLEQLCEEGLVERIDHDTNPPHVAYELTEKGQDLDRVLEAYLAWAKRWSNEPVPETLAELRCGEGPHGKP